MRLVQAALRVTAACDAKSALPRNYSTDLSALVDLANETHMNGMI